MSNEFVILDKGKLIEIYIHTYRLPYLQLNVVLAVF